MLVCAGLFVVVSHHVFQPEVVHRKIRRQQSVSKSVASSLNAAVAANPEHSMAATRDTAAPESPVTAATAEPHHTAQPAPTRNLASMLTQASLASSALVPYEEQSEFTCKPDLRERPTRPLDYIVPPESAEWPQNCAGREDLCNVLRTTAVAREVMVAVCNSAVTGQLSKWVEANRRAGVTNIMIVAIDNRLPKWLEVRRVAPAHEDQHARLDAWALD